MSHIYLNYLLQHNTHTTYKIHKENAVEQTFEPIKIFIKNYNKFQ